MSLFDKKEKETDKYAPVEYHGHGLWRCRDGCLRDEHGGLHDVGPFDYYLRVPIPEGKDGRVRLNFGEGSDVLPSHGVGETLPNVEGYIATIQDTNLPPRGRIFDESLDLLEVSWHMLFLPEHLAAVQVFLVKTVFEFYVGGEKPFYQCNMAAMARWEPYAAHGSFVLPEALPLRRVEKRWVELVIASPNGAHLEMFVKAHCRRYRGVC